MATNFTTFLTHPEKVSLTERCSSLIGCRFQVVENNSKWNPMSISVRLYYDFIGLNGRNRRTVEGKAV